MKPRSAKPESGPPENGVSGNRASGLFNTELKLRIASGLVMAVLVVLITWVGGRSFSLLWSVLALAVYHEYTRICRADVSIGKILAGAGALSLLLLAYHSGQPVLAIWILIAGSLVLAGWEYFEHRRMWIAGGLLYAGLPMLAMSELRGADWQGFVVIMVLFGCVWGADILAYFAGRTIGGPKLAPRISPKKTWSGFVGAMVGAVLLSWLVVVSLGYNPGAGFLLLMLVLGIVSQLGDLVESSLKRRFDVKDSGTLIPGHGGILDRIDGLVAVAVILWLALTIIDRDISGEGSGGISFERLFLG